LRYVRQHPYLRQSPPRLNSSSYSAAWAHPQLINPPMRATHVGHTLAVAGGTYTRKLRYYLGILHRPVNNGVGDCGMGTLSSVEVLPVCTAAGECGDVLQRARVQRRRGVRSHRKQCCDKLLTVCMQCNFGVCMSDMHHQCGVTYPRGLVCLFAVSLHSIYFGHHLIYFG